MTGNEIKPVRVDKKMEIESSRDFGSKLDGQHNQIFIPV